MVIAPWPSRFGRTGFERQPVRLLQPKLGRVFDGDHALARVDHLRQGIEHRRLTRTGTARDDDVHSAGAGDFQHGRHFFRHRSEATHHVERDRLLGEFTNRDGGAAKRQRRDDDVDAAAVLEAGVASGAGLVDAAADLVHDPLRDLEQMLLVAELDLRDLQLALAFDVGLLGAVDHDVADGRVGEQLFERAEAEQLVDQHLLERELLAAVEGDLQLGEHFRDDRAEFLGELVLVERRGGFGVDALEQARKHLLLDPVDRGFETLGLAAAGSPLAFWRAVRRSIAPLLGADASAGIAASTVGVSSSDRRELVAAWLGVPRVEPRRCRVRPSWAWRRQSSGVHRRPCRPAYRMRSFPPCRCGSHEVQGGE